MSSLIGKCIILHGKSYEITDMFWDGEEGRQYYTLYPFEDGELSIFEPDYMVEDRPEIIFDFPCGNGEGI